MIQEELSSLREESFQIWVGCGYYPTVQFVCERYVIIEVKRTEGPVRILKYQILEMGCGNVGRRSFGGIAPVAPVVFTARLETGKDLLPCPRVTWSRVNFFCCVHL